ncbi:MAG: histidine--tRNA ligase [Pseudomonadota bacterium]|nr:MAG: histidine--tRNA ligase [Pseudomonadota bacterium]
MSKHIQAIRGMNDLLPDDLVWWQRIEEQARSVLHAYGYREIRFPVLEKTDLYRRSIGEVTDIVEKEMYTFEDRNGESLTLRPEGTAGCVRAGIENGILHNQVQRLWYLGPMFRHERPQKGRYRQFHQIGVEAFGMATPDLDTELLLLCQRLWRALGVDGLTLELNSLGTSQARAAYREALVAYLQGRLDELDEDSRQRLHKNPLRVLDSKNPAMQPVIGDAPKLTAYLDDVSLEHFATLGKMLAQAGIKFVHNPRLVRGLDYYTRTVFEWTTDRLGAQSAVCAGGRYDGLVSMLGGQDTAAAGFAIGLERLVELLQQKGGAIEAASRPQVYVAIAGETEEATQGLALAETLREEGFRVECHCGGGSLKSQLKRADRSGAKLAILIGRDEIARGEVGVKVLASGAQEQIGRGELTAYLRSRLV